MIIEKKLPHSVQNVAGFETSQFTIEADSHIFQMFSSGVYTDVVKAIIRELSTNAVDAHLDAGTSDLPFDIHLPNIAEPYFSIRDYGTGLSIPQIKGIYSTYLKSTKTDTNTAIGGLGIGSKSPFAYTDNFTITSYHNGHVYIFSTFKDDNGIPSLAQLHEGVSDQPNGLEIQFSVEKKDFTDFQEKAKDVFFWFSSPFKILNGFELKTWKDYPYYETDDFIIFRREGSRFSNSKISVLMGQISYPIVAGSNSLSQFHSSQSHDLMYKIRGRNWEFVVKAPIGSVNFVPSREHLKSTKNTNDFLIEVFSAANIEKNLEQIRKKIEDDFLKLGCWEIANFFNNTIPGAIFEFGPLYAAENKAKLEKELLEKYKTSVDPKLPLSYADYSGLHLNFGTLGIQDLEIKIIRSCDRNITTRASKNYEVNSSTNLSALYFFYQTKKVNPSRAKLLNLLSEAGSKSNSIVFLDQKLPLEDQKQKIADFLDVEIDNLLVYTEDNFKKSSSNSKPKTERVPLFYVMEKSRSGYQPKWLAYSRTKEEVQRYSKKVAYVKIKKNMVLGDLSDYSMTALAKAVETLSQHLGFETTLIFATEFSAAHLDPLWIELRTALNDFWVPLCDKFEKESYAYTPSYIKLKQIQSDLRHLSGDTLFTFGLECDTKDPVVSKMMSLMQYSSPEMKEASNVLDKICFAGDFIGQILKQSASKPDEIFQKYPLLRVIDRINTKPAADDLIGYINHKGNKQ